MTKPSIFSQAALYVELIVLFFLGPIYFLFYGAIPELIALSVVTLYAFIVLIVDKNFRLRQLRSFSIPAKDWKLFAIRSLAVFVLLYVVMVVAYPMEVFNFPLQVPLIWLLVMIFYPLLSALPQELLYRSFFFHRYRHLFSESTLVIVSSVAFAHLHIVFKNLPAVLLSLIAGYIFSVSYKETRSLLFVTLEHAVYGCLMFTLGLGMFFYNGPTG